MKKLAIIKAGAEILCYKNPSPPLQNGRVAAYWVARHVWLLLCYKTSQ